MNRRNYRVFTPEELIVIKENSGKKTLAELAEIMNINYSNLSSMLNQHRVFFAPLRVSKVTRTKTKAGLTKEKNEKGEMLLTDKMMTEYAYY